MTNHPALKSSKAAAVVTIVVCFGANFLFSSEDFSQAIVLAIGFVFFNIRAWVALIRSLSHPGEKALLRDLMVNKFIAISLVVASLVMLEKSAGIAFVAAALLYAVLATLIWKFYFSKAE